LSGAKFPDPAEKPAPTLTSACHAPRDQPGLRLPVGLPVVPSPDRAGRRSSRPPRAGLQSSSGPRADPDHPATPDLPGAAPESKRSGPAPLPPVSELQGVGVRCCHQPVLE
jgi:hypothetical protein